MKPRRVPPATRALLTFAVALLLRHFSDALQTGGEEALARCEGRAEACTPERTSGCDPTHAGAFLDRGRLRFGTNNPSGAIGDFDEVIRLEPRHAWAHAMRGSARTRLFDIDGAIADFTEALRLCPGYAGALSGRGFAHRMLLRFDLAVVDIEEAIRLDPELSEAYFQRSNVHLMLGDLPAAVADLDAAIHLNPDRPEYAANRCLVAFRLGEQEGAEAACDKASARAGAWNFWVPMVRGGLHLLRDEAEAAGAAIGESLNRMPRNPHALLLRGHLRLRAGDAVGGAADLDATRSILPSIEPIMHALFGPLPPPDRPQL